MVHVEPGRAGDPTARLGSHTLVSRYDPRREALRFVQDRLTHPAPRIVVVLGEVLGYLTEAVRTLHPDAAIVAVYYSPETVGHSVAAADASWHPDLALPLEGFLERNLPEECLEAVEALEWAPANRAFPTPAEQARTQLRTVMQRLSAGAITVAYFAARWFRNAVVNYLCLNTFARLEVEEEAAIVIAASGPSLNDYLPALVTMREQILLWALPSAVLPLRSAGIVPDMVVATDGGVYAAEHLEALRGRAVPIAMPLTAGRGVWRADSPVVPLCQGGIVETAFSELIGTPSLAVPPNGTVAGSALELALRFKPRSVTYVGLDLCSDDIRLHARPHAYEHYYLRAESRFSPYLSFQFAAAEPLERMSAGARRSRALETYAAWFSERLSRCATPVYRVPPAVSAVEGMVATDALERGVPGWDAGLRTSVPGSSPDASFPRHHTQMRTRSISAPPLAERKTRADRLLGAWRAAAAKLDNLAAASLGEAVDDTELLHARELARYLTPKLFRRCKAAISDDERRTLLREARERVLAELDHVYRWIR